MPSKTRRKKNKSTATKEAPKNGEKYFRNYPAFEKKKEAGKKMMVRENFPDEIWERLMNRK